uniref:hypothetical protein n=1 Tax=uncultured Alcanivorax sp. TaxID=191215 RepID=UPI002627E736
ETSREVIEQFARLHAKWWNNPELEQYEWAKWLLTAMPMEQGLELLKQSMIEVEETGKFDAYPERQPVAITHHRHRRPRQYRIPTR